LLEQLNNVAIDPSQIYVLRNAQITRDRLKLYFDRGFVGFLTRAAGEVTGAVFSGDGEILLIPPNPVEKRSLSRFIQSPILEERFTAAYLRFTDQTARELLALARRPDPEDSEQPTDFVGQWDPVVHSLALGNSLRILQDLLGDRAYPLFRARIHGVNLPLLEVEDDERLPEAVSIGTVRREGDQFYNDVWCSFPSRASQARFASLLQGPVRVHAYTIDTRILPDNSLEGRAELQLESLSGSDRVLRFELSRSLKVSEVEDERGQSLVVFPNPSGEQSPTATRSNDWVQVVLPSPHPAGEIYRLILTYRGNVIADVGNGVLYVGARGSWYPNCGLGSPADYDLTFHCPKDLTLVATGTLVEEKTSEGYTHSHWRSEGGFRLAGFNLGPYDVVVRRVGKTTLKAYATQEAEVELEKRHDAAQRQRGRGSVLPVPAAPLTPSALLEGVADSAQRAVAYYETLFGPFPYPQLAISQVPGSFGQGWPELVYLPTLSFLYKSERSELGLGGRFSDLLQQAMLPHEIAHQWWGNLVGWKTYRDQWLSEGLANYAAVLYLAQGKDGGRQAQEIMSLYKQDLLGKTKAGATIESGGPIVLGQRLSDSLNPEGYVNIVYKKACWVLHMLRGLVTDPTRPADQTFFKMLRDFIAAHQGEEVSTEDFIRHAEKYMTRASDLEHNGKLDWFFNEWVYGTGIPTYKLESSTRRLARNKFLIQGTIEQSGVESNFEMLVPVLAVYGSKKVTLGRVAVGEAGGRFQFPAAARPSRVVIDEDNLLAVVP
jgi:hypothetical protein